MTITVTDDLAEKLQPVAEHLPNILEIGLREWTSTTQSGYSGVAMVLEFFASLPSPEALLTLRPSAQFQARIDDLLTKSKENGLNSDEAREWSQYENLEHWVRMAKIRAYAKLNLAKA